ncbi:MAG: DUF4240 domain-containing protein [Myxococcota bacterium]
MARMDLDQFWQHIARSRVGYDPARAEGNMDAQLKALAAALEPLAAEELVAFRDHFEDCMDRAHSGDLWSAAYLLAGGCSDDGFADFRSWLISMGREVYKAALGEPDTLAGPAHAPGVEDVFFAELRHVAGEVYQQRMGQDMPDYAGIRSAEPRSPGSDDDSYLQQRFPDLWSARRQS